MPRHSFASHDAKARDLTSEVCGTLVTAKDFLLAELFAGQHLPDFFLSIERLSKETYGHYWRGQFITRDGAQVADKIALNARHLHERSPSEILEDLLHEMCHLWQAALGLDCRISYHDKVFANLMERVGLITSTTGAPGGARMGVHMLDYPVSGGVFEIARDKLLATGWTLDWGDRPDRDTPKKSRDRVKYYCPNCEWIARGKPDLPMSCFDCGARCEVEAPD
jgi:hypothetical protein